MYNVKIIQKPNQTINIAYNIDNAVPNKTSNSHIISEKEICRYGYEVTAIANSGYLPGELTVMKNGIKSSVSGLLDGDLEISVTDAIEDFAINLYERYNRRTKLTPEDIAEITNPKLIAKDNASIAFSAVEEAIIPKIMINTSNVTNMNGMFYNCKNLVTLNLSNFDTSKVTNMETMFYGCQSLVSLDLSNFDTSNVKNMEYMFFDCSSLETLDISNFDTSKVTNIDSIFVNCDNLKFIILNNKEVKFKYYNRMYFNKNCRILVPRDSLNKYKSDPGWNKIENKIVAIEDYTITRHDNGSIDVSPNNPVNNDPKQICGYIEQIVDSNNNNTVIASHVPYDYTGTIIKSEPLINISKEGYKVESLFMYGYKGAINYQEYLGSNDIYKENFLKKYINIYIQKIIVTYREIDDENPPRLDDNIDVEI